jgi:hypothetical protein
VRQPARSRLPVWLLLVIVGAGAATWALAPKFKRHKADPNSETTEAAAETPPAPAGGNAELDLSRLRRALEVLAHAHADPGAPERRGALNDVLAQGDSPSRLTILLEAAAADPTQPDKDPLWPDLVQGLSAIFQGDAITSGMDLMLIESRPRARDAVVSSFAKLALERSGELTPEQRQKLTEYFIDLHNKLPALQQREVETAARKIAGDDVADLMQGKGMASDDELQVQRDYKRALQDNQRVAAQ